MKKVLSLLLMVMIVVVLSACNKEEKTTTTTAAAGTTTTTAGTTTTAAPKVVKFAVQADSTDALQTLVDTFNGKHNGYEVQVVDMTNNSGQMHDQLVTSLSSGSQDYDVISMDVVWAGEFAGAGYLSPLDTFIVDSGWTVSDFNAGSMDSGKLNGKHYALPYFPDLGFLYYRADIVDATDTATLQSGDYTWANLLTMAEKYNGDDSTTSGIVYQSAQYEGLVCNLNEFTANWTDVEGGLAMMKAFTDSNATPDTILSADEGATHNAFLQGHTVFARNWPYMNGMVSDPESSTLTASQVGYAPLPDGGSVGGWIVGINKNTDQMAGAKEFIKFLAGPEGQKINSIEGSYLPGFNDLLTDTDVTDANALLTDPAFQIALQTTIARPVAANYSQVSDLIQLNAHKYLSGDETLAVATANIEVLLGIDS